MVIYLSSLLPILKCIAIISPENQNFYNISITLHGFLMIFFLVMPGLFGGFGNYFVPIFQGSPEVFWFIIWWSSPSICSFLSNICLFFTFFHYFPFLLLLSLVNFPLDLSFNWSFQIKIGISIVIICKVRNRISRYEF